MTGNIVRHEREDYVYSPTGLMVESWGKTGHRTEVSSYIAESRLQQRHYMDNDESRDSIMYLWSLDDATLLAAAHEGTSEHQEIIRRLSSDGDHYVNPNWVAGCAAVDAYDRGLIDEYEMDWLAR